MCRMEYTEPISSNTNAGYCLVILPAFMETSFTLHIKIRGIQHFLLLMAPTLEFMLSHNAFILMANLHCEDVGREYKCL